VFVCEDSPVKSYTCRVCGNRLFFENSVCVSCETPLGYSRAERDIVPLDTDDRTYTDAEGGVWHVCANLGLSGCTWLTTDAGGLCFSCGLTRTRPNDADLEGISNYAPAERAKRHLIAELDELGIPILDRTDDPRGVAFDLLSSVAEPVTIGHADGIVTIDLAEAEDAHREKVRAMLDEPYRTMLGHFRHEIGHYYESFLITDDQTRDRARELFGDESEDYQAAIDRHYAEGAPDDWQQRFISQYATMHPWEDFAETWAHYLHISDSIQTAEEFGLLRPAPTASFRERVTKTWMPLSTALNMMNRSMGYDDLYPFVLSTPVLDKLDFVAGLAADAAAGSVKDSSAGDVEPESGA
jgi:hypothetical protein|tara:strand:+ start:919 stop:1980 length:1062 start_codon:yes stop_codon:yes gene_type:complete